MALLRMAGPSFSAEIGALQPATQTTPMGRARMSMTFSPEHPKAAPEHARSADPNPTAYVLRVWRQTGEPCAQVAGQVEVSGGVLSARFSTPGELAAILHAPSIHLRPQVAGEAPPALEIKLYRQVAARG